MPRERRISTSFIAHSAIRRLQTSVVFACILPGELGQRKGTSQIDSMASSRAWLEEQDLAGFDADPEDAAADHR